MKVVLYGGTFDPIHYGHLIMAEEIRQRFLLDQVHFIPSMIPPHKNQTTVASPSDRLLMVNMATLFNPSFFISSFEIERGGTSYSIDTILYFKSRFTEGTELFFLMGVDAFIEISTWKDFPKVLTSCRLIITSRPGYSLSVAMENLPSILKNHHHDLSLGYFPLDAPWPASSDQKLAKDLLFVEVPAIDISSTMIQQRASTDKSLQYLVPPTVEAYIKKYGLYSKKHKK